MFMRMFMVVQADRRVTMKETLLVHPLVHAVVSRLQRCPQLLVAHSVWSRSDGIHISHGPFDLLKYGNRINGPAVIEQVNTTTFITPEYRVLVDRFGNYSMYLPEKEDEATRRIIK